jgi:phenylacetate-CoA ligase
VQVVDPETAERLPDGELGSMVLIELYKTGSAQLRDNPIGLSYLYPRKQCACGSWLRRIGPFAGRGDNMVKLRGINVWPEAVGEIATASPPEGRGEVGAEIARTLKDQLGVQIGVELVEPGSLDEWTGVDVLPKLKRFRDDR